MPSLMIAANYIFGSSILTGDLDRSGHLQIVYDDDDPSTPLEEAEVQATNPYAYTKLSGEILSEFYTSIENLDIVIARPFPHTGPGQSADFVCSDWALQIAQIEKGYGKPEIKVGDISVQRDFTDVRDVVEAYVLLLERTPAVSG